MSKHETVTITVERYLELLKKESVLGELKHHINNYEVQTLLNVNKTEKIPDVEI
jgi:hypothetical protein